MVEGKFWRLSAPLKIICIQYMACVHTEFSIGFLGEQTRFWRAPWRLDDSDHVGEVNVVSTERVEAGGG